MGTRIEQEALCEGDRHMGASCLRAHTHTHTSGRTPPHMMCTPSARRPAAASWTARTASSDVAKDTAARTRDWPLAGNIQGPAEGGKEKHTPMQTGLRILNAPTLARC